MPEHTTSARPQIVLGIDFGLRRIGLAVGDTLTRTARPLPALTVTHAGRLAESEWLHLARHIRECGASQIVVGCPYNVDGSAHGLTDAARAFARELQQRVSLPLHLEDERYSSLEATQALRERRESGRQRGRIERGQIDSAAAAVILERWLTQTT
ncbi:MAG: Holliday junction resolvase RuvX [Sinobacteraceae bacterium]|nr:Holliday junction resolvase RuvX [Nevskiaceae bacterium]